MGSSRDLTGSQLGPYHLDKRYEDLDDPGSDLYAAHHVDTDRPALVLVPGPDSTWAPRSDWTALVTSQVSPPFLATQLVHPPASDTEALEAMDLAFIRMTGGIASVEGWQEANADFTRVPQPTHPSGSSDERGDADGRRVKRRVLAAAALALGMVLLLWPRLTGSPGRSAGTLCPPPAETVSFADSQMVPLPLPGYPMPSAPFAEQMKPPCEESYVELRGGCWYQGARTAPCPKGSAEYEGKCYVPVREKKPEPRSVQH